MARIIAKKKSWNTGERKSLSALASSKNKVESSPRQTSLRHQQTPTTITQDSASGENIPKQLFSTPSTETPSTPKSKTTKPKKRDHSMSKSPTTRSSPCKTNTPSTPKTPPSKKKKDPKKG